MGKNIVSNLSFGGKEFDITKFIRHFWLSKHKKVTDRKLYKEIKNSIIIGPYNNYDELIIDLEKYSKLYGIILYPNETLFPGILKPFYYFLQNINTLSIIQVNPLILSLLNIINLENFDKINSSKLKDLIILIENFIFVYKISGKSPSPLEGLFSTLAINFNKILNTSISKKIFENEISKAIEKINKLFPKEEEFTANLSNKLLYLNKNQNFIKYFFNKIYNSSEEQNLNNITIEHIYPRNPEKFKKIEPNIINSIGNLTILGPDFNRKSSNMLPKDKIFYYKESSILKNSEIAELIEINGKFDKIDIENRTRDLTLKSWNIFRNN